MYFSHLPHNTQYKASIWSSLVRQDEGTQTACAHYLTLGLTQTGASTSVLPMAVTATSGHAAMLQPQLGECHLVSCKGNSQAANNEWGLWGERMTRQPICLIKPAQPFLASCVSSSCRSWAQRMLFAGCLILLTAVTLPGWYDSSGTSITAAHGPTSLMWHRTLHFAWDIMGSTQWHRHWIHSCTKGGRVGAVCAVVVYVMWQGQHVFHIYQLWTSSVAPTACSGQKVGLLLPEFFDRILQPCHGRTFCERQQKGGKKLYELAGRREAGIYHICSTITHGHSAGKQTSLYGELFCWDQSPPPLDLCDT